MQPVQEKKGCGKVIHQTKSEALQAALRMADKEGCAITVYGCPKCKGLHISRRVFLRNLRLAPELLGV